MLPHPHLPLDVNGQCYLVGQKPSKKPAVTRALGFWMLLDVEMVEAGESEPRPQILRPWHYMFSLAFVLTVRLPTGRGGERRFRWFFFLFPGQVGRELVLVDPERPEGLRTSQSSGQRLAL